MVYSFFKKNISELFLFTYVHMCMSVYEEIRELQIWSCSYRQL